MKKLLLVSAACLALASCGESDEEKAQRHDKMCQSYGAKFGTPEYIQCRATIVSAEAAKQRSDDASALATVAFVNGVNSMATAGSRR